MTLVAAGPDNPKQRVRNGSLQLLGALARCLPSFRFSLHMQELDIFEDPCDSDPPIRNFKNFQFFRNSLKKLNVYFWGDSLSFGADNVYFWGNKVHSKGFSKILVFWEFLFCGWGGLGTLWVGGPIGVFEKR